MKKSLEEAQGALKCTKERVSRLMDDTMLTSIHHFEVERRLVSLLHPRLDSPKRLSKTSNNNKIITTSIIHEKKEAPLLAFILSYLLRYVG